MWFEILAGLAVLYLVRLLLLPSDPAADDLDSRASNAVFAVASRLEKVFAGKAFVGLWIPDPESGTRRSVDVVVVTKSEVMVVAVRNCSGYVEVGSDGSWVCNRDGHRHKQEVYPNPVAEVEKQIEILKLYLEQRGLTLPEGYLVGRVVLPNPDSRVTYSLDGLPEVISYKKWSELRPESSGFCSWVKVTLSKAKVDEFQQKLHSILSTSPMWDRLELKGDKKILGEFIELKGKLEDAHALINVDRSKVSRIVIQKSTAFSGLGRAKVHLLLFSRDYRTGALLSSESEEATVKANVEVIFRPINSKKAKEFKISHVVSLTLSV